MSEQATISTVQLPTNSHVSVKIEVQSNLNVSAFVARQKANRFLILQVSDQLMAAEPELNVGMVLSWRIPVHYTPSKKGNLGIIGHLLVNAETGEVNVADGHTTEDLIDRADTLYERTAL